MFVTTLFIQALLATAAFAIPTSRGRFGRRTDQRASGLRSVPKLTNVTETIVYSTSENWSGAVHSSAKVT